MSDDDFELLIDNDDPLLQWTLTQVRNEFGDRVAALRDAVESLEGTLSDAEDTVEKALGRVADEVSTIEMLLRESPITNRRRHARVYLDLAATVGTAETEANCIIMNMSVSGAAFAPRMDLEVGQIFWIDVPGIGPIDCEVVSLSKTLTHVRFGEIPDATRKAIGNMLQEALTPLQI